ncbi:phosphoribosylaminoimidazolesuccinocarboxamide synthase, partial [Patescibacteria group bacterium]|nr:phosphoribosylaminoimidazolesuccinocarboxamide synthase [Patescibacteria group bacterium]
MNEQEYIQPKAGSSNGWKKIIQANLNNCISETNLEGIGKKLEGKVRDIYDAGDKMVFITTDRQSAFDRVLALVPFKGQVLNEVSAWWFEQTKDIIPNHVISVPDPNVTVGKKCKVFPVEVVVRGYLTGSTETSAWTLYEKGERNLGGNVVPDGMMKNTKFETPIITPTTKDEHDENIEINDVPRRCEVPEEKWETIKVKALEVFQRGMELAKKNGMILVDTKYEFGEDEDGNLLLIDEIHTPDSSRYWLAETYEGNIAEGKEPDNIDKEFLRLWFKENCDPYKDEVLPKAPDELIVELAYRYITLYEKITGLKFKFPEEGKNIQERIQDNLKD